MRAPINGSNYLFGVIASVLGCPTNADLTPVSVGVRAENPPPVAKLAPRPAKRFGVLDGILNILFGVPGPAQSGEPNLIVVLTVVNREGSLKWIKHWR